MLPLCFAGQDLFCQAVIQAAIGTNESKTYALFNPWPIRLLGAPYFFLYRERLREYLLMNASNVCENIGSSAIPLTAVLSSYEASS
jgi:hypothetical protein